MPVIESLDKPPYLTIYTLPDEEEEAERAAARNGVCAAATVIEMYHRSENRRNTRQPEAIKYLEELGMPQYLAEALVRAGIQKQAGVKVKFTTIFEKGNRPGHRPRHYENFRLSS